MLSCMTTCFAGGKPPSPGGRRLAIAPAVLHIRIQLLGRCILEIKDGRRQIKVGDYVKIYGPLINYKGYLPETVANRSYILDWN